jgi:hypothetical protein
MQLTNCQMQLLNTTVAAILIMGVIVVTVFAVVAILRSK